MIERIKKEIIKVLAARADIKADSVDLVYPENAALGDLSLPVFKFARVLRVSPQDIAAVLAKKLDGKIKHITEIRAVGGYLNFFIDKHLLIKELLTEIAREKSEFGNKKFGRKAKKVLIEFVSPNSNKPLHLGHLRNAVIGEAVARLLETQGARVVRANLVNDRGIHICKAMVAYKRFGKVVQKSGRILIDSPNTSNLKSDHFVGKYYILYEKELKRDPKLEEDARDCLMRWEAGDKKTIKLWKTMRRWALDGFKVTYATLGLKFDRLDYESEIWSLGKEIANLGIRKKIFSRDASGAVVADLAKFNLPNKVLLRADGTSIYITTDLYLVSKRYQEEKFDKIIYVVGSEQDLYFKQFFAILQMLDVPFADKAHHLSYGMVFLPEGKMKSREGIVVDADDLIAKLQSYAAEEIKTRHDFLAPEEIELRAKVIALAALKFYLLAVNPPSSMHFDPKESLSFTGKTGPYLLYTLVRMKSILHKSTRAQEYKSTRAQEHESTRIREYKNTRVRELGSIGQYLQEKEEHILVVEMGKFPEALARAAETLDPEELATYLYNLARAFSDFYEKHPVLDAKPEIRKARLALVEALAIVTEKGLHALGIETLGEM